jgi:hypothetical protein
MTCGELHIKTNDQRHRLIMPQLLLFTSAIMLLSVLNYSHGSVEIKRPVILLAASVFALIDFKKIKEFSVIAKIILLYIIEMFFNRMSGRVFHIQSFTIHLSLTAMLPLAVSFVFCKFQKLKALSIETNDLLKSWAVIFAIIVLHMLFLFPLLKNTYGYGYAHNFGVLANMCLYFLVFVFSWDQLKSIYFRRITAMVLTVLFLAIVVKGL